ncbi:MAG: hemolysin family protein [Gaiellaceae bacterium]
MTLFLELLGVAALILLNGFFVAGEYGLVTARRTRLRELEEAGSRRARAALTITENPPRFIAAMQLGVTGTSLAIGAVGEPVLARLFDPVLAGVLAFGLAFLLITYLHVVVGELVPKGLALGHSEGVALAVSGPVRTFFFVFNPLIWFLQRSSDLALRALGLEPPGAADTVYSEAELKMLLSRSADQGELEEDEQEMLYKVFDFADKEVADVMVPRPEVVALSVDLPPEECLAAVIESPYTRYPVYRGSLEHIVGILHVRDLFSTITNGGLRMIKVEELVRPAPMVPETKDLAAMLKEFRRTNQHMAIVVDEYGEMEGIVTLEDLLEEIVGEIEDEFDLPDESIERVDERTIRIDGTFPIDDFNEQFGRSLPDEDYHTVGGFVFGLLGRQPEPGNEVEHESCRFKVLEVEGSRIERLEVELDEREREPRLEEAS